MHKLRLRSSSSNKAAENSDDTINRSRSKGKGRAAASSSSKQQRIQHVGADLYEGSRPAEWNADHHSRPANLQQSPQLELPDIGFGSSNDFRTSLILPELTARFAMLRAKDGSVLPLAEMQSQLRIQRETGALTAQEEQAVLDQYRLQSQRYTETSPTRNHVKHPQMTPSSSQKSLQSVITHTPPQRPAVPPRQLILGHQRSVSSTSSGGARAARSPTQVAGGYKTRISQRHRTPSIDMNGSHDGALLANLQSPPVSAPSSTSTHDTGASGWSHAMTAISSNSTNTTSASSSTALAFTPSSATTSSSAAFPSPLLPSPAMSQAEFYAARDAARGNGLFSGNAIERDILQQVAAQDESMMLGSPDTSAHSDGVSVPIVLGKHSRPRTRSLARTRSPVPPPAATAADVPVPALPNGVRSPKRVSNEYDPYNPTAYQSDTSPHHASTSAEHAAVNGLGVPMLTRQQAHRISRALVDIEQNLLQQGLVHIPSVHSHHNAFGSEEIQKEWDEFAETYTDVNSPEQTSHAGSSAADSHGHSAFMYDDTELIDPPLLRVPLHDQAGDNTYSSASSPNLLSVTSLPTARDSGQSSVGSSTIASIYGGMQTPSPLTPQVATLLQTQQQARALPSSPMFPPPTTGLPPLPSQRDADPSPADFTPPKFPNSERDSFASVSSSFQGSYGQLSPTETFRTSFPHFAARRPDSQHSRRVASSKRDTAAQERDATREAAEVQLWLQQAAEVSGLDIKDLVQIQEVLSSSQDSEAPTHIASAEEPSRAPIQNGKSHSPQPSEESVLIRAALAAEQAAIAAEQAETNVPEVQTSPSRDPAPEVSAQSAPDPTPQADADADPVRAPMQSPFRNLPMQDYQYASPAAVAAYVEAANNKATIALKGAAAHPPHRVVNGYVGGQHRPTHSRGMSGSEKGGSMSRKKSVRQLRIGSPALVQTSVNLDNAVNLGFGQARNTPSPGPAVAMSRTSHDAITSGQLSARRSQEGSHGRTSGSIRRPRKDSLQKSTPNPAASTFSSPSSVTQAQFHSPSNSADLPTSSLHGSFRRMLTKLKRRKGTSNDAALIPNPMILSPNAGKPSPETAVQRSQADTLSYTAQSAARKEPQTPDSDTFGEMPDTAPLRFGTARGDVSAQSDEFSLASKAKAKRASEASVDSMQKLYQAATALGLDSDKVQELLTAAGYDHKAADSFTHQGALSSIQEAQATPVLRNGSILRAPSRRKAPPTASSSVIEASNASLANRGTPSVDAEVRHERTEAESQASESLDEALPVPIPRLQPPNNAEVARESVSAQTVAFRDVQSIYGMYDYEDDDNATQDEIVVASGLLPLPSANRPQRASMIFSAGTDLADFKDLKDNRKSRVQLTEYANGDIAFNIVRSLRGEPDVQRDTMYGHSDVETSFEYLNNPANLVGGHPSPQIASRRPPGSPDPMRLLVKHPLTNGFAAHDRRRQTSEAPVVDVYEADEDQIAALMETLSRGLDQGQFDVSHSPNL